LRSSSVIHDFTSRLYLSRCKLILFDSIPIASHLLQLSLSFSYATNGLYVQV
jgi:hypothetical protein